MTRRRRWTLIGLGMVGSAVGGSLLTIGGLWVWMYLYSPDIQNVAVCETQMQVGRLASLTEKGSDVLDAAYTVNGEYGKAVCTIGSFNFKNEVPVGAVMTGKGPLPIVRISLVSYWMGTTRIGLNPPLERYTIHVTDQ